MYGIKVFLAGSTNSNAQKNRNSIRCRLSRLQNRLSGLGKGQVALFVYDYKDFESSQTEYNKFIQSETDIFIAFVNAKYETKEFIEKEEGKGTYAEFQLACQTFLETGKPEVILLYKKEKESTKPSKRWLCELGKIGKYAIDESRYHELYDRLDKELSTAISKFLPDAPEPTQVTPSQYKIGDVYEKDGVKGIIFSIDESGKSGKILSIQPSIICSWQDFQKKKSPFTQPWRVPQVQELEEILMNQGNYQAISKTLKNLKDSPILEHNKYNDAFLSSTSLNAFCQKCVRWSHTKRCFSLGDCQTSHAGIIRPVAEVKF